MLNFWDHKKTVVLRPESNPSFTEWNQATISQCKDRFAKKKKCSKNFVKKYLLKPVLYIFFFVWHFSFYLTFGVSPFCMLRSCRNPYLYLLRHLFEFLRQQALLSRMGSERWLDPADLDQRMFHPSPVCMFVLLTYVWMLTPPGRDGVAARHLLNLAMTTFFFEFASQY